MMDGQNMLAIPTRKLLPIIFFTNLFMFVLISVRPIAKFFAKLTLFLINNKQYWSFID